MRHDAPQRLPPLLRAFAEHNKWISLVHAGEYHIEDPLKGATE